MPPPGAVPDVGVAKKWDREDLRTLDDDGLREDVWELDVEVGSMTGTGVNIVPFEVDAGASDAEDGAGTKVISTPPNVYPFDSAD